jgi:adenylosuccinate lyase/3-carboxy-cis,cis-muconate cycloisomerase
MGELLGYGEEMARDMTVYPRRMEANLGILKGLMLSESVMIELGKKIGKQTAHEVIYENATKAIRRNSTSSRSRRTEVSWLFSASI